MNTTELEELEAENLKLTAELKTLSKKECESGLVLLASVAFVMIIFYLVHSKEAVVRKQTWDIVSTSISIFAAVMLNTFLTQLLIALGLNGSTAMIIFEFVYLILFQISAVLLLYLDRDNALRLLGYGTVFGHILGFAAIGAYGTLAESPRFHESQWMTLVVIVIYIVTIPVLVAPTSLLGRWVKHDALHEQCKETGLDFFAMGLSFLISMFFRGWIKIGRTGTAAGELAVGTGSKPHEVGIMIAVGVLFVLTAGLFHYIHQRFRSKSSPKMAETFHVFATIAAMTGAWCWFEAANWVSLSNLAPNAGGPGEGRRLLSMPEGVFMAKLMVAAFFTLVFVLAIYLFAWLIHRGGNETRTLLKGSMTAVALVVALSWEHLFDTAIEEVAGIADSEEGKQWLKVLMSFLLVLVVLPAWMVYILPKHNDELKNKYANKQLSIFASCGDCCDTDDDDEGYDYDENENEEDYE